MESFDAKIARAEEHLDILKSEIQDFVKLIKHKAYVKTNPANNTAWIVYHTLNSSPPIRIGTIIGDCVHNMRSALDNLICGLIRVHYSSHDCVNRQFPIATTTERWTNRRTDHTEGVPEDVMAVIKSFQPCFGPDELGLKHPLAILQHLDNINKHRTVLLTVGYDVDVQFAVHANGSVWMATYPKPIFAGPITIPFPPDFDASTIPKEVKVEFQGSTRIILRDLADPDLRAMPVTVILAQLLQFFKEIFIPKFKPFFE